MRLVPSRYTDTWHKEIDAIVGDRTPLGEDYEAGEGFPWNEILECTARHIITKKGRSSAEEVDGRLIKLIDKSTRKDVALAACCKLLSPAAVRFMIIRDFSHLDTIPYLKLLCVASLREPLAVTTQEATAAKALLVAHESLKDYVGQYLKALFELMIPGIPATSLVYASLHTESLNTIPRLVSDLITLRSKQEWEKCWKLVSWLSSLPSKCLGIPKNDLNPIVLLDRNFRGWRLWISWRPGWNLKSERKLSQTQCASLRDYLALDGPDEQPNPRSTICSRLRSQGIEIYSSIARLGAISFKLEKASQDEARMMLDRLYKAIQWACEIGSHHADLFIELCVEKEITYETLEILESIAAANESTVTLRMLLICKSLRQTNAEQIRNAELMLPLLSSEGCQKLRHAVAPIILPPIIKIVEEMQHSLLTRWNSKLFLMTEVEEAELHTHLEKLQVVSDDYSWISDVAGHTFGDLVKNIPTAADLSVLQNGRTHLLATTGVAASSLMDKMTGYFKDIFVEPGSVTEDTRTTMKALISFWKLSPDLDRLSVAILISQGTGKFRSDCILKLPSLPDAIVLNLKSILEKWHQGSYEADQACDSLAKILASTQADGVDAITCWRPVLYRMMKSRGHELVNNAATYMKVADWFSFLQDIRGVFGDIVWNPKLSPSVMRPGLHQWAERLTVHSPTLLYLEQQPDARYVIYCILSGGDENLEEALDDIVCHLTLIITSQPNSIHSQAGIEIISQLSNVLGNASNVRTALCSILQTSNLGAEACSRFINICRTVSKGVARALLPASMQDDLMTPADIQALKNTADLLGIGAGSQDCLQEYELNAVADYMDSQYAALLSTAQQLDSMRIGLKTRDFQGITQLLKENEIEDTAAIEDAFSRLPTELLNVVEQVGDSEVEIIFPLTSVTQLQRAAMGVRDAQSLLLRLQIGDYGDPPRFCLHLDNETSVSADVDIHSQWVVFKASRAPELPICHGSVTPVTYQLARTLSRFLAGGYQSLQSIHALVTKALITLGSECITCGTPHGATLRRATTCDSPSCKEIFSRAHVAIRLSDIRQDPAAVDMLLTMLHAAINSGYHHILPDCPLDKATVVKVLQSMPSIESLSKSNYFFSKAKLFGTQTEQLLTWVCCNFRGFLSSATGPLRIPSLPPGTQQFILANAAPMKEFSFLSETGKLPTRVVFHGTSLDRLFSIMCQGLKVMSGTPLQAYGAASGPGIYLADEPSTSYAYADRAAAKRANWKHSKLKSGRVLLGCELAGAAPTARGGIHVIKNESSVMVRYVFLVPTETPTVPIAGHLAPAMMSVYNALRTGAL